MRIEESKYGGVCATCNKNYPAGAPIEWVSRGIAHHAECWDARPVDNSDADALADRLGFEPRPE